MKRKLLYGSLATLFFGAGVFTFGNSITNKKKDLLLANVEAMAAYEESAPGSKCYNTITTKKGSKILYCSTCKYIDDSTDTTTSGTGNCVES